MTGGSLPAKPGVPSVLVRRVYGGRADEGTRVLVDRVWPRGLSKADAELDEWCKEVAPSQELRRWYGHDPARFDEFARRYREELGRPGQAAALRHLRRLAHERPLVLLTATKDVRTSQAAVVADLLREGG